MACNPNFFDESATFTIGARTVTGADLNVAARLIYAESSSAFSKIDGEYIGDRVNDERNAMASVLWNLLSPKTPTFKDVVYSGLFNAATTKDETGKFDGSSISTGAYRRLTERTVNSKGKEGGGDCNDLRGSVDAMRRLQRNGGPFYDFNRWRGKTTPVGNSTVIGGSRFGYAGITITSKRLGAW